MNSAPQISVVIPARDEEAFIGRALDSIDVAAAEVGQVEVVVVINRCTDSTEAIARERGAVIVHEDTANLAVIRNAGIAAARGEVIVTLDADSALSPNFLGHVMRLLGTGRYVGGGTMIRMDRLSLGMLATVILLIPFLLWARVSGGAFWFKRADFDAIGGFDAGRLSFEDVDFARRLKAHGRTTKRRWGTLRRAWIVTSARKFDLLGDWYLVRHPGVLLRMIRGMDRELADRLWYETKRDVSR